MSTSDQGVAEGKLLTETFPYDNGRQVAIYIPQRIQSVIFTGDGQRIAPWGKLLETKNVMIVGVHSLEDETARLKEYSPVFDAETFAAHESFIVHDVRKWVESRFDLKLDPQNTAIYGTSAGGELALALGLRHPDLFGAILCASPGAGYKPPTTLVGAIPRTYLVAGTQEPFFRENARIWATALSEAGVDVVMKERTGKHGGKFWREEFPLMVAWAFGATKTP